MTNLKMVGDRTRIEENTIEIDRDVCDGCGLCVSVCPTATISLVDGKATISGGQSISCEYCEAVCPRETIHVNAIGKEMYRYETFASCGEVGRAKLPGSPRK